MGWRHTYHIIGLASLAFCALFGLLAASSPAECWYISDAERSFLVQNIKQAKPKPAKTRNGAPPAESLFTRVDGMPRHVALHPGLWAVFIAHMAYALHTTHTNLAPAAG